MSVEVEKLEHNMAKLTIEVPAEEFIAALDGAYRQQRGQITIPGFRKGKAPRKMIQQLYGAGFFYEDAANTAIQNGYAKAAEECGEEIESQPEIDIVQIEEGKPFIFTAEVAIKPEVKLGDYLGLEIEKVPTEVSEEEVDAEVDKERDQNARIIDIDDRPVKDGDMIRMDFEGFVDGEPFEGGQGTDYPLTVGSGSFIPGFEEQLVGKKIDEDFEVNVTFPEDYQAEDLKGKDAVFKCRINSISVKELPEADDDFAQDVSEFDTLEEYKNDIRQKLESQKAEDAKREKENQAIAKAVANAEMDIPDAMVDEQVRRMTDDFAQRIQQQGISLEQYLQLTGMTMDSLAEQMRPDAVTRIQNSLVLEAIAKAEDIQVSDERLDEEIGKMADSYQMEPDTLKEMLGDYGIGQMKNDIAVQMAVDLITDRAVEKPEKKKRAARKKKDDNKEVKEDSKDSTEDAKEEEE